MIYFWFVQYNYVTIIYCLKTTLNANLFKLNVIYIVKCHRRFNLFDLNICSLKWLISSKKTKRISFLHVIKIYKSKFLDNLQIIFFTHFCFQHMITSSLQSIVILHHWLHCDNHHTKYFVDLICLFLFYQNFRVFAILLIDIFFILFFKSFSIDFLINCYYTNIFSI